MYDWKNCFEPKILDRGLEYYRSGMIARYNADEDEIPKDNNIEKKEEINEENKNELLNNNIIVNNESNVKEKTEEKNINEIND